MNWKCFALLAALCNASIGIFSKNIFVEGISPGQVAFYKCLISFLVLSAIILFNCNLFKSSIALTKSSWKIAVSAFFGIFVLYYFETTAYSFTLVPTVVFILLGASSVTTVLMSRIVLKEIMQHKHYIGFVISIIGLYFIFSENDSINIISTGSLLAMIAGIGYGIFLSIGKKLNPTIGSLPYLWWFLGFGTLFLFIPTINSQSLVLSINSMVYLISLALIPTLGGYYCTTQALKYGPANQVQLFELTEPLFASIMGFAFLGELLNHTQIFGAILILLSIYISTGLQIFAATSLKSTVNQALK